MSTAASINVPYSELLDLDIRKFNCLVEGNLHKRETEMNDMKLVGHLVAGKIAAAVWGDSSYKRPIKEIKLTEEKNTAASRNARVLKTLKAKGLI